MNSTWHGLTDSEVIDLWDRYGWRERAQDTLIAIARHSRASHTQRLAALSLLNGAMEKGLLDPAINYPAFAVEVMSAIVHDASKSSGWRARRVQKTFDAQISGLTYLIRSAQQFIETADVANQNAAGRAAPALDALLS